MSGFTMKEMVGEDGKTFMAPMPTQDDTGEATAASPAEPQEEEGGVVNAVLDVGKGIVGGIRDGLQETGETIQWAAESAGNAITGGHDIYKTSGDDGWEWLTKEEVQGRDDVPEWQTKDLLGETLVLPEVSDNTTVVGGLSRGVSQFLTGYATMGKAMKGVQVATKGGAVVKAAVQGAGADFMSFDAHEERFSDFLRDNLGLADPITEYLSADEDDSVLEGKLKNVIEGIGMGIATDGILRLAKSFKKAKKVKATDGAEKAAEVMNDEIAAIADEGQLDMFNATNDPNVQTGQAAVDAKGKPKAATGEAAPKGEASGEVTAHNSKSVEAREAKAGPIDVKSFQEAIDYEVGLVKAGSEPDPNRVLTGKLFNFDKMDTDVSTLDFLNMASDAIPESALQDPTTFAKMNADARKFLSESIDVNPEVIDASLANMAKGMKKQQGVVLAGKQLVQSLSREVETLAYKISDGLATDADFALMVRLQSRVVEVSGNLKSVITGAAQTTSAGRIMTTDAVTGAQLKQSDITQQLLDSVDAAGGRDAMRKLADDIITNRKAGNGLAGTMRVTANRQAKGFWAVANEVRINGLLSGPKTHVINTLSNGLQTLLLPAEKFLGGAMAGDRAMMRQGAAHYAGIAHALKDSLKAAKAAAIKGRNIIDPEAAILEANGSDFRSIQSTSDNALVRNTVNILGNAVRLPSRGLLAGDELFKQINYRADLYSRLVGQSMDLLDSGQITKAEASKWIADRMEKGFARDGSANSKASIEFAREATFTNDLRKGSIPKKIQDATNQHPALKVILPFVRTPTNLIVASVQRTPLLHRTSKLMMADLNSGDAVRVASARGKLATGTMLWGSAITAAMEGKITGSGPVDYKQKERLMETGWRPYSVKVGDKFISYERLDPFAMFFGIAADFSDIGGQMGESERGQVAAAGFAAIANNVASKTWLRGITDAADAFVNPERRGESYINNMITSFTPFSSALREARKATDDQRRDTKGDPDAAFYEMQSLVNSFRNMVPGYSKTLPARRSWVTGETVAYPKGWGKDLVTPLGEAFASMNPIYEGTWKKDPVLDELANLDFAFSAPTRSIRGVEMTPEQYGTYVELHGKVRAPGSRRTMYQELQKLFDNKMYDVKRERAPDFGDPEVDPRIKGVRRIITAYRQLAQAEMLTRYPELKAQVGARNLEAQQNQRSLLSGVIDLGG